MPGLFFDATKACKKYVPASGIRPAVPFCHSDCSHHRMLHNRGARRGDRDTGAVRDRLYSSTIFVAGWLGEALLGPRPGMGPAIGRLALGLFILHVLRVLPYVGRLDICSLRFSGVLARWCWRFTSACAHIWLPQPR